MPDRSAPEARSAGGPHGRVDPAPLVERFRAVRSRSTWLCEPLATEDYVLQCMTEASPTRWHLAHTTWFFERFVLQEHAPAYDAARRALLLPLQLVLPGARPDAPRRTAGSSPARPSSEVLRLPARDRRAARGLPGARRRADPRARRAARDPGLQPRAAASGADAHRPQVQPLSAIRCCRPTGELDDGGVRVRRPRRPRWISLRGRHPRRSARDGPAFHFDNEGPRHEVLLRPHRPASPARRRTREFLAFVEDGGYERPELLARPGLRPRSATRRWTHPLYWFRQDGALDGVHAGRRRAPRPRRAGLPRQLLRGRRLRPLGGSPAAHRGGVGGGGRGRADPGQLPRRRPRFRTVPAAPGARASQQLFGDVWEWTSSAYVGVPGLPARRPAPSASTTASSCATSTCCAAAPARPRGTTCAPPIATSSRRTPAGSSPASDWRRTRDVSDDQSIELIDLHPPHADLADGGPARACAASPKTLPCKLFYDKRGSELFEAICELPEYYPTRTEIEILRRFMGEITAVLGPPRPAHRARQRREHQDAAPARRPRGPRLLRARSTSPRNTSGEAAERIHARLPRAPGAARLRRLPAAHPTCRSPRDPPARHVVFFPGSTIGNFHPAEAREFLDRMADLAGPDGGLLIGVDLRKKPADPRRGLRRQPGASRRSSTSTSCAG